MESRNLRVFTLFEKAGMSKDLFRNRLDEMINLKHPLAVLASRLSWDKIQAALKPQFTPKVCPLKMGEKQLNLLGKVSQISGGNISNARRPRRALRLMTELALLNLSDEELVVRLPTPPSWWLRSRQATHTTLHSKI
jgi:transposase, IS5 family